MRGLIYHSTKYTIQKSINSTLYTIDIIEYEEYNSSTLSYLATVRHSSQT